MQGQRCVGLGLQGLWFRVGRVAELLWVSIMQRLPSFWTHVLLLPVHAFDGHAHAVELQLLRRVVVLVRTGSRMNRAGGEGGGENVRGSPKP